MSETKDARATKYVGWGIGLAMLPVLTWGACVMKVLDPKETPGLVLWLVSCVGALFAIGLGIAAIRRGTMMGWVPVLLGVVTPVVTFLLGVQFATFSRGRALRRRGKGRLPTAERNRHWRDDDVDTSALETSDAAAKGWRANGATELASIAAFSSLSNQLLALGAPASFIEYAHQDALDEVRHARLCYEIAAGFASSSLDAPLGAGPLPAAVWPLDKKTTPASVAKECLVESCVMEGASARAAALLAERAEAQAVQTVLEEIAVDEARHAEHGWEMLVWLWPRLTSAEADQVSSALEGMKRRQYQGVVSGSDLEKHGLAGTKTWQNAVHEAIEEAEKRLQDIQVVRRAA